MTVQVLINTAGIMAAPYEVTLDGFETQFVTNHLGHFLFTNLIRPRLIASQSARIVNISSAGHRFSPVRFEDVGFSNGTTYDRWQACELEFDLAETLSLSVYL